MAAWEKWITTNADVMMGKPVIRGTRITVELILERLGAGETVDDLLISHHNLSQEAIQAALAFAADVLRDYLNSRPYSLTSPRSAMMKNLRHRSTL